jgi:hypothetical protein
MKLTGAAILVSRGMEVLQAAPAAYPYRSAEEVHVNVEALLTEPHRKWSSRPPASEEAIARLQNAAPGVFPKEYIALLRYSNGGEGPLALSPLYFMLYEAEYANEVNQSADQRESYPGHFVIGSNGGLEPIAFDTRATEPWPIIMYDAVAGTESDVTIAKNMEEFIGAIGVEQRV